MKINGKKVELFTEVVVLPRGEKPEDALVFKCKPVLNKDYDNFKKLCPVPTPPMAQRRGEEPFLDITDPEYREALRTYSTRKYNYMVLMSISATDGLEWSKVDMGKPETWDELENELKEVLTLPEFGRVMQAMNAANGLDDEKIRKAKDRFMSPVDSQPLPSSPTVAPVNTASGEPAKG